MNATVQTIATAFSVSIAMAMMLGIILFLLRDWLLIRLKEGIATEYTKTLEVYKQDIQWENQRRLQAARMAEILARDWRDTYDKELESNDDAADLYNWETQKLYWELALWLDSELFNKLNRALLESDLKEETYAHKEVICEVRKILIDENDPIRPEDIIHWDPVAEEK